MDELIEALQSIKNEWETCEIKACTILIKNDDGTAKLITNHDWGVYTEDIYL